MQDKQIELLKYIYHSPKTFKQIMLKFNLDDEEFDALLNGDDYFYKYFDFTSENNPSKEHYLNQIVINNYGLSFIDERNERLRLSRIPIVLSVLAIFISVGAIILSPFFNAYFSKLFGL